MQDISAPLKQFEALDYILVLIYPDLATQNSELAVWIVLSICDNFPETYFMEWRFVSSVSLVPGEEVGR